MTLQNDWIGYVTRSYQQVKSEVLTVMQSKVPEITDHTESNLFVKIISIWAALSELLHYYIDNAARELFLSTTRQYDSAVKIGKMFDYRIRGVIAATGTVQAYTDNNVVANFVIPIGTIVVTEDGIEFITISQAKILAGTNTVLIPVRQEVKVDEYEIGTSNGTASQRFELEAGVRDNSWTVKVGIEVWEFVETFAYSTDNDKVFSGSLNRDKEMEIIFGDGVNGAIPPVGASIKAAYGLSVGSNGNLSENSINAFKTAQMTQGGQQVKITNLNRTSGGHDVESLEDLKKLIPLSIRTLRRAVTRQDYIDIAELQSGVASADVVFKCGKTVDVYIVPEGGGIATQQLLDYVKSAYYDSTRMITTEVRVLPAGEVKLAITWRIKVKDAFNQDDVEELVFANIKNYINVTKEKVNGYLQIGDLYEVIEGTQGVDYSEKVLIVPTPYARIVSGTSTLDWQRNMKAESATLVRWVIKYTSTGDFILQRNGVYAGTFLAGAWIVTTEIDFKIASGGTYVSGDTWEFYTYPYNDSIKMNEPSVFRIYDNDLTLEVTGGI